MCYVKCRSLTGEYGLLRFLCTKSRRELKRLIDKNGPVPYLRQGGIGSTLRAVTKKWVVMNA